MNKVFKTKWTRIKERAKQRFEIIELHQGYSYNLKQDRKDFCPFFKKCILLIFFSKKTEISFVLLEIIRIPPKEVR